MFGFKRKRPEVLDVELANAHHNTPPLDPAFKKTVKSSYIDIISFFEGKYDVVIRGGNNKIRYVNVYNPNGFSLRNARRAAKLLSEQTGLPIKSELTMLHRTTPTTTDNSNAAPRGKHYSHVNSVGVKYYLNMKYVSLRAGELVPIYYFSKDIRKEASPLPSGFQIKENPRNGFLTVKTPAMIAAENDELKGKD